MGRITILKENSATRCEICHQADMLDGLGGTCQRCKDLSLTISQSNLAQVVDGNKENATTKRQRLMFLTYNLSEIIVCISMIVGITLFVFFPELVGASKESIKYFVFFIGLVMAGYNYAFGGEEGQARATRIAVMGFVFALWQLMIIFLKEIN